MGGAWELVQGLLFYMSAPGPAPPAVPPGSFGNCLTVAGLMAPITQWPFHRDHGHGLGVLGPGISWRSRSSRDAGKKRSLQNQEGRSGQEQRGPWALVLVEGALQRAGTVLLRSFYLTHGEECPKGSCRKRRDSRWRGKRALRWSSQEGKSRAMLGGMSIRAGQAAL